MILLILILGILYFLIHNFYLKRRNLPPGPTPWPLFGNVLTLKSMAPGYEAYKMWARQYGPVYTMWMGTQPMVIITDYEIMKSTILKDGTKYAGRAPNPINYKIKGGDYGVLSTSGELWSQQRRFAIQVLKDFGLGKNGMEERVLAEVTDFISKLGKLADSGPIDLQTHIDIASGSVINDLLFGYRYDESNVDEYLSMKSQLGKVLAVFGEPLVTLLIMFPFLGKLPYFKYYDKLLIGSMAEIYSVFQKQIDKHKLEIDYNQEENADYCEAYLKEQKKHETEPDYGGFSDRQFVNMCHDLWLAGVESTSNTVYWGLLYVLRDAEVQKKIHEEIDRVIGKDKYIIGTDKSNLHYINAVIQETQRLANLAPLNVPRRVLEDVVIEGFKIPKNSVVVPQISTVLLDDKIFPDPYKFDPSRHLDSEGRYVKLEEVIPFSLGKRVCLGEGLARTELFLIMANFFQFFEMRPIDKNNLPSIEKNMGEIMKAANYQIHLISRK